MGNTEPKITISENGPYEVTGGITLAKGIMIPDEKGVPQHWEKGADIKAGLTYYLCRCGNSKHKPFCDNSHLQSDFNGTETADTNLYNDLAVTFNGPQLEYKDVKHLCASARFCARAGGIRHLVENPETENDKNIAIQITHDCPSGKLRAINIQTREEIDTPLEKEITVAEDPGRNVSGPLWVKGKIPIESFNGTKYEVRNRVALCRCGHSRNKPYCDGSHIRVGFKDGDTAISEDDSALRKATIAFRKFIGK